MAAGRQPLHQVCRMGVSGQSGIFRATRQSSLSPGLTTEVNKLGVQMSPQSMANMRRRVVRMPLRCNVSMVSRHSRMAAPSNQSSNASRN